MFGGYGISVDGLTVAIMTDLGQGEKLWLKAEDDSRALFEAAGCQRFGYLREGVSRGMNYYSAPEEAMDSPQQMAPWARLALEAALTAAAKATSKVKASTKVKPSLKAKAKVKAKVAAPPASGKSAKTVKPRS
jgi:DNA transformation protein and related proteins